MASSVIDVCRFNPTLGGTTDWTYSSAVTGYQSPSLAGAVNGSVYSYRAESNDLSQWECGTGAYTSGTGVFSRTTVLFNSSGTGTGTGQSGAGTKITFSTVPQVAIVALAEDLLQLNAAQTLTSGQKIQVRANIGAAAAAEAQIAASPADPTGTASATGAMMGIGGTCAFTPTFSQRAYVHLEGYLNPVTSGALGTIQLRFGTGTAPSNGDTTHPGTAIGKPCKGAIASANPFFPFSVSWIVTGLTLATAIWVDAEVTSASGTVNIASLNFIAFEIP